jgi:ribosomal protein L11 methylase PrmA
MAVIFFFSYLVSFFILAFVIYIILRPMLFGAIYFPTTSHNVAVIKKFADIHPTDKIADLGSGDGRIVIAFAEAGIETHGYEINPFLVIHSREEIRKAGLNSKAVVRWQSFWKADLSQYNTVIVYGFPHIMKPLGEKFLRELAPGTKVISNVYQFPNLTEIKSENKVRLYIIPAPATPPPGARRASPVK